MCAFVLGRANTQCENNLKLALKYVLSVFMDNKTPSVQKSKYQTRNSENSQNVVLPFFSWASPVLYDVSCTKQQHFMYQPVACSQPQTILVKGSVLTLGLWFHFGCHFHVRAMASITN